MSGTAIVDIRQDAAPALGDVRLLGEGDHIYVFKDARARADWPRYAGAIGEAVGRGASVLWLDGSQ
jgi:hypothetical protein